MSSAEWPKISATKLASIRRLLHTRGRADGAFLAEGPQAVREALVAGVATQLVISSSAKSVAVALAMSGDVPVVQAAPNQMDVITDTVHGQGIVAVCELSDVGLGEGWRLVLILDEVRDPGNVGTLIRTADAFGADAVLTTPGTADPLNPKSVRASVGSVFHLPIVHADLNGIAKWSNQQGLSLLAADTIGQPLNDPATQALLTQPTGWIVGNEAAGLSAEHLAMADQVVTIPMPGKAESLNVATAAGICLYLSSVALAETG